MVKNYCLARAIAMQAWGELLGQLLYKADWSGKKLVAVDRFFPNSKRCHLCHLTKSSLCLSERTFECEGCLTGDIPGISSCGKIIVDLLHKLSADVLFFRELADVLNQVAILVAHVPMLRHSAVVAHQDRIVVLVGNADSVVLLTRTALLLCADDIDANFRLSLPACCLQRLFPCSVQTAAVFYTAILGLSKSQGIVPEKPQAAAQVRRTARINLCIKTFPRRPGAWNVVPLDAISHLLPRWCW